MTKMEKIIDAFIELVYKNYRMLRIYDVFHYVMTSTHTINRDQNQIRKWLERFTGIRCQTVSNNQALYQIKNMNPVLWSRVENELKETFLKFFFSSLPLFKILKIFFFHFPSK